MPWLNNPSYGISEGDQRGDDVWELLYSDWGLLNGTGNGSTAFPPIVNAATQNASLGLNATVAGIAIGERSTVDRAWISYNLQKNEPSLNQSQINLRTNRLREVSVDSPLIFSQPAAQAGGKMAFTNTGSTFVEDPLLTMVKYGSLFVWPWNINPYATPPSQLNPYPSIVTRTVYTSTFIDCNNQTHVFPPTNPVDFVGPFLHLYFYLKGPNIAIPTKRAPLTAGKDFASGTFDDSGEHLIAVIATFGRKSLHVMLRCSGEADFRIGALRVPGSGAAPILATYEEPIDQGLNVPANTPTILAFCNQTEVNADYITLYCSPHGDNFTVSYRLTAYD